MRLIVYLFISLFPLHILAQNIVKGTVKDAKTGETLIGCNVYIQGTITGTTTDLDGNYTLAIPAAGSYNLVSSYISYNQSIKRVVVEKNKTTIADFELEPVTVAINEVRVTAAKRNDTELSMISSIKSNSLVSTGVASQQIAKSQDRDASEVIRRIPGITIVENRFVIVRGLSERYNNVILNEAPAPSSESDIRAFSFDVLPSSMIERLIVYKTPAPELPGDFSGGVIKITTKNVPEKNSFTLSYSASYLNGTTGKEFLTGQKGKNDWLAYDDGSRNLPSDFPENLLRIKSRDSISLYSKKLNNPWSVDSATAPIDQRISLGFSRRINIGSTTLGNVTNINYSNTYSTKIIDRASYSNQYNAQKNMREEDWKFQDSQFTNNIKLGILHNWAWAFGANNKIEFRNFFNHVGYSRFTSRTGNDFANLNVPIKSRQFDFMERTTYSGQIGGFHQMGQDNSKLDWVFGYNFASRNQPNIKRLFQAQDIDPESEYYKKYYLLYQNTSHLFMNTKENIYNVGLNFEKPLEIGQFAPVLKAGIYSEFKDRKFSARSFQYESNAGYTFLYNPIDTIFKDKYINANNGLYLQEVTNPSDSYDAKNSLYAGYVAFNIHVTEKLKLYLGVRYEKNTLKLNSFETNSKIPLIVSIPSSNLFPSANLSYNITEKSLVRLAYGITTNRPEFREVAPFHFYNFELYASIDGNFGLKNAFIQNFDARYEFYPSESEMITLGGFMKLFENPIESVLIPQGSNLSYSFKNAKEARSVGLEAEIKKSLINFTDIKFINNISLVFNGSLIDSKVTFDTTSGKFIQSERPLQGQSPYIVNAGIFYASEKAGTQVSLLYNVVGKRILYVGSKETPDIYELPRNMLDLTFTQKIGKYVQLKGGIQDILNNTFTTSQYFDGMEDTNADNVPDTKIETKQNTLSYKPGTYYTLGVTLNF